MIHCLRCGSSKSSRIGRLFLVNGHTKSGESVLALVAAWCCCAPGKRVLSRVLWCLRIASWRVSATWPGDINRSGKDRAALGPFSRIMAKREERNPGSSFLRRLCPVLGRWPAAHRRHQPGRCRNVSDPGQVSRRPCLPDLLEFGELPRGPRDQHYASSGEA